MEHKRPQKTKLIMRKKNNAGDIIVLDLKLLQICCNQNIVVLA